MKDGSAPGPLQSAAQDTTGAQKTTRLRSPQLSRPILKLLSPPLLKFTKRTSPQEPFPNSKTILNIAHFNLNVKAQLTILC